ncbi:hypothetical protein SARC_07070 [Sphaeroforma arctica JP610]|uniref:RGS domain-containing protein n=1 Tax=Sphaeroforma arctica JP610 TaxID=667725 RepID=A0A0L0FVL0_9EUKA|nr:hypothetical protein SARC_07070 [Sphaeroforma arctica JP610]KNC80571.1 hypothetical protein SARC_07070 [Sphaeroforma arctica JP610]|eukprot:XP_014154473.1 hypothetical protein SARC_07070 [Sphaeroforma arctica JP610]
MSDASFEKCLGNTEGSMSNPAQTPQSEEKPHICKHADEHTISNTGTEDTCTHIDIDYTQASHRLCSTTEQTDLLHPTTQALDTTLTGIPTRQINMKDTLSKKVSQNDKRMSTDTLGPHTSSKGNFHRVQRLSLLIGLLAYFISLSICALVVLYEVNVFDDVSPVKIAVPVASSLVRYINDTVPCSDLVDEYTDHVVNILEESGYENKTRNEIADYIAEQLGYTRHLHNALVLAGDKDMASAAVGIVITDYLEGNYEQYNNTQQLRSDITAAVGDDATLCLQVATLLALNTGSSMEYNAEVDDLTESLGTELTDALGLGDLFGYTRQVYLLQAKEDGLDGMFIVCTLCYTLAEVLFVVVGILVYKYRSEPEIFSRHRFFLIHFNVGGLIVPPAALLLVAVSTAQLSLDYKTNDTLYTVFGAVLSLIAVMGPISAVFLRQRFMYQVFWKSGPNTSDAHYFIMLPWYLLLSLVIIATDVVSHYIDADRSATQYISYIPIYIVAVILGIEFSYYVWRVRHSSHVFVDVWQAYRFLIAWLLSFLIFHFAVAHRNSMALGSVSATLHLVACLVAAYVDFFLLPILKVFGRRNGLHILEGYDFAGCTLGIDFNHVELVLDDPEACALLLDFLRNRVCSEGVEFLIELRDLQLLYELENKSHAEYWERVKHISDTYIYPQCLNLSSQCQKTLASKLRELRAHLDKTEEKSRQTPKASRRRTHISQQSPQVHHPSTIQEHKRQSQSQSQATLEQSSSEASPLPVVVTSQSYISFPYPPTESHVRSESCDGDLDGGIVTANESGHPGLLEGLPCPASRTCPTSRTCPPAPTGLATQISAPGGLVSVRSSQSNQTQSRGPMSPITRSLHRAHSGFKSGLVTLDSQLKNTHGDGAEYEQALKAIDWGEVVRWFDSAKKELTDLLLGGQLREFCTQSQMRMLIQKRIAQNNTLMEHRIVQSNTIDGESPSPQPVQKVGSVGEIGMLDIAMGERSVSVHKKRSTITEEMCTTLVHDGAGDAHASIHVSHDGRPHRHDSKHNRTSNSTLDDDLVSTGSMGSNNTLHSSSFNMSDHPRLLPSSNREVTASVTRVLSSRLDQLTSTRHAKRTSHPYQQTHPHTLSHTSRSLSALPTYLRSSVAHERNPSYDRERDGDIAKHSFNASSTNSGRERLRARRGSINGPGARSDIRAQTQAHPRTSLSSNVRMSAESVLWNELAIASQNSFCSLRVVRTSSIASVEKGGGTGSPIHPSAIAKPDGGPGKAEKLPTSNVSRACSTGGLPTSSLCAFARDIARADKNCTNVSSSVGPHSSLLNAAQTIPMDDAVHRGGVMSPAIAESGPIYISDAEDSQDEDSTTCV